MLFFLIVVYVFLEPRTVATAATWIAARSGIQLFGQLALLAPPTPQPILVLFPSFTAPTYLQLLVALALLWTLFGNRLSAEIGLIPPISGGISDAPLADSTGDTLNRAPIAASLCALLLNPKSEAPFTVAITAPWGAGKTSFLNMVDRNLMDRLTIVRLNPWHFREDSQLLGALLENMRGLAIPQGISFRNLLFRLRLLWIRSRRALVHGCLVLAALLLGLALVDRVPTRVQFESSFAIALDWFHSALVSLATQAGVSSRRATLLAEGAPVAASLVGAATLLKLILDKMTPLSPAFEKMLKQIRSGSGASAGDWSKHAGLRHQFQREFTELCRALGSGGWFMTSKTRPGVVLLIDDLDRCEPRQIEAVVATLNFLFSTPAPCFALVGMDWEKVVAALAVHFKEVSKTSSTESWQGAAPIDDRSYAEQYLEKIIQLRIELTPHDPPGASITVTGPDNALSTVNWWALPVAVVNKTCQVGVAVARLALRGLLSLLSYALALLGRVRAKAASPPSAARMGATAKRSLLGSLRALRERASRLAFMLIAAIPVVLVAWALPLYRTDADMLLTLAFESMVLLAAAFVLVYVWLKPSVLRQAAERIGANGAVARVGLIVLPALLFFYVSDISRIWAGLGTIYFLASIALRGGDREHSGARDTLDLFGGVVVFIGLFALPIPQSFPPSVVASWGLMFIYLLACIVLFFWSKEPMLTRFMTARVSYILGLLRVASSSAARLLGFVFRPGMASLIALSFLVALLASEVPQFSPAGENSLSEPTAQSMGAGSSPLGTVRPTGPSTPTHATMSDSELLLFGIRFGLFILLIVLVSIWVHQRGLLTDFVQEFFQDHVVVFENSLESWLPHLRQLKLNPRVQKQLVNRSRYVVTRWHVSNSPLSHRAELAYVRLECALRKWLNREDWSAGDSAVPMTANLLSHLTLLNSVTFGGLLLADSEHIESLCRRYQLDDEVAAVVRLIPLRNPDKSSLEFRQLELWKRFEESLPIPAAWKPTTENTVSRR